MYSRKENAERMKKKGVVEDLRDRVRTSDFQIEIVRVTQTDQLQSDTLPAELPRDLLFFYPKVRYLCAWCTMSGFIHYSCVMFTRVPNCYMVLSA